MAAESPMSQVLRRRLRFPVFGRLVWAWMISGAGALMLCLALLAAGSKVNAPTRVALALGPEIQHLAPPEPATAADKGPKTQSVLPGKAGPALREGEPPVEPPSLAASDMLGDDAGAPAKAALPQTDHGMLAQPGAIRITIDGAPARDPDDAPAPAGAVSAQTAAYVAPSVRVAEPIAALEQQTRFGPIPKIAADGRRASSYYALPDKTGEAEDRVALIVGGLGLNAAITERAIKELPPEVTLSFAPYAKNLPEWAEKARAAGHEVMIELPMEGYGGGAESLGPAALLTSRTAEQNLQRLDWLLSRFPGYFAATNYLGGKFSADKNAIAPILTRLKSIGVAYVDDTGAARRAVGDDRSVARVDRIVTAGEDGDDERAAARDLDDLASIAKERGAALGKTYAYPAAIDAIVDWTGELGARHVALAPASAVIASR